MTNLDDPGEHQQIYSFRYITHTFHADLFCPWMMYGTPYSRCGGNIDPAMSVSKTNIIDFLFSRRCRGDTWG